MICGANSYFLRMKDRTFRAVLRARWLHLAMPVAQIIPVPRESVPATTRALSQPFLKANKLVTAIRVIATGDASTKLDRRGPITPQVWTERRFRRHW